MLYLERPLFGMSFFGVFLESLNNGHFLIFPLIWVGVLVKVLVDSSPQLSHKSCVYLFVAGLGLPPGQHSLTPWTARLTRRLSYASVVAITPYNIPLPHLELRTASPPHLALIHRHTTSFRHSVVVCCYLFSLRIRCGAPAARIIVCAYPAGMSIIIA